jgi:hypothetical protein
MEPFEIFAKACAGYRKVVADRLHLSTSLVNRWCSDPSEDDTGRHFNPLHRLIEVVRSLRDAGAPEAEAPILYACDELGYIPVRVPAAPTQIVGDLSEFLEKTSAYLHDLALATKDGFIDEDEYGKLEQRMTEVIWCAAKKRTAFRAEREEMRRKRIESNPFRKAHNR